MGFQLSVILCLQLLFLICQGRPDGAPKTSCSTLMPEHPGATQRNDRPPFSVSAVSSGEKVRITISSSSGEEFQGFILQARSARDKNRMVDGQFTQENGVSKAIDCFSGRQNTLTHVNTEKKNQIFTEWVPAEGFSGEVIFRATVAKTYYLFWMEIDSTPVRVKSITRKSGISNTESNTESSLPMYENCFVTKGCFGYPSDCVKNENCEALLTYADKEDGVAFQLTGRLDEGTYMAMGLSDDKLMGGDSVTECFMYNGRIVLRESWNNRRSNEPIREIPEGMFERKSVNGLSSCSWTKSYKSEVRGKMFDLATEVYYLLISKGPMSDGNLQHHFGRIASQQNVNLTAFQYIGSEGVSDSVKIHGTFMITAWIGLVSLGILLARHFKAAWENHTILGVKVWFAFHRGLMITALVFVIIALIVIFVHKKGWDNETDNPHAVLGCVATALGLCQPIMSAFRPSPDHPKRPLFNWLHWSVGNSAQIIAVVTMFFAVSLQSSGLKESFYWVLAIFVIVHCLFHFLFQLHTWTTEKKRINEVKMVEMSSGRGHNNSQNMQDKNASGNVFRILLLGIYGIFLAVIIMALYSLVGVAI